MSEQKADRIWNDPIEPDIKIWLIGGIIVLFFPMASFALSTLTQFSVSQFGLVSALMTLLFAGALIAMLRLFHDISLIGFFFLGLTLMFALLIRIFCLDHITADYVSFLSRWLSFLRENGGFSAIGTIASDYNVPYLYLLAGLSYIELPGLFLIKIVSIIADLVLALGVTMVVRQLGYGRARQMLACALALFAPTVWMNSGLWAQCDSVYALFIVFAFYFALKNRQVLLCVFAGLAFAFKLQAVFFFPLLILLALKGKLKFRNLLWMPASYLIISMPAMLFGRTFSSLFTIYTDQVGLYSQYLSMKAPSIFSFVSENVRSSALSYAGVMLAFAFVLGVIFYCLYKRFKLTPEVLLTLAFLFCVGVPWLLPSMHERYFYLTDIFSVLYVVSRPKRWFIAPLSIYASYAGYHAYLFGEYLPFSMWLPALMLLIVIAQLCKDLFEMTQKPSPDDALAGGSDDDRATQGATAPPQVEPLPQTISSQKSSPA